jgi:hypothetical protein
MRVSARDIRSASITCGMESSVRDRARVQERSAAADAAEAVEWNGSTHHLFAASPGRR